MSFRETESLLDTDGDYGYRTPKNRHRFCFFAKFTSVLLPLVFCGFILFFLWIAFFEPYNANQSPPLTSQLGMAPPHSKNDIKSLSSSPNPLSSSRDLFSENHSPSSSHPSQRSSSPHPHKTPKIPNPSSKPNTTIYHYNFTVTQGIISPDNFPQLGYLINGLPPPGPEIRVKQHSILLVTIKNSLPSSSNINLTFHFHGIHQRKSFLSDGVPFVTQNPIPPGGTFTHEIDTWPQVGTMFYHAHTGMDIVWLFGPMIIEDDPKASASLPEVYHHDEERVFILNGIYHEPLPKLMEKIEGPLHSYPAVTHSISINGRSYGKWGHDGNDTINTNATGYYVTSIEQGKTYRFRFINAASDSLLSCRIDCHRFTVIETDGVYVEPVETDRIVLTPGQRYSAILKADQEVGNYPMICEHMESAGPRNGIAYLHYEGGPRLENDLIKEDRVGEETLLIDRWVIDQLHPNLALNQTDFYLPPPGKVDKEFVMDVFEAVYGEQHVYLINGHFYEEPAIPYFEQLSQGLNITNAPQMIEIIEGDNVQIVFQNQRMGDFCFSHPWHVHGHSFHVVGEGPNRYDPILDGQRIQEEVAAGKKQFMFRDSVTIYANQTVGEFTDGAFCGWGAIRFSAHNPGLWLVHCHVTPHMIMGKKFGIWEHSREDPYLKGLMNGTQNIR